tara:strand:+ start:350 stop:568 length:219 start_codon:yes stop_codon:yes gene_type:complete
MIILVTVASGFILLIGQILFYEIKQEIEKIKKGCEPLFKDGGIYPKTKPIVVTKLNRTMWVKPAPLYLVISK